MLEEVTEQLELLDGAGETWDLQAFLSGEVSPCFWGSAMSNFGVEPLLDFLAEHAAHPGQRVARLASGESRTVDPGEDSFTGFVFKIQANMNPRHRDRVAFIRVVSGKFERGMDVVLGRTGETLRMAKPHTFMADERSIVEEAFPGDIVGLYDPGKLRIGDTVAASEAMSYDGIPRFAPEFFGRMVLEDPLRRKALDSGLEQLAHEGVIQTFYRPEVGRQDPWLGAVGMLQFEVLKERLKNEYRVTARLETLKYKLARWIGGTPEAREWLERRRDYRVVQDRNGNPVLLAETAWAVEYALREDKGLKLFEVEPL